MNGRNELQASLNLHENFLFILDWFWQHKSQSHLASPTHDWALSWSLDRFVTIYINVRSGEYSCHHACAIILNRRENSQTYAKLFFILDLYRKTYVILIFVMLIRSNREIKPRIELITCDIREIYI